MVRNLRDKYGWRSVYLSGPMTGKADWNYPAFHRAASALRDAGLLVLNPASHHDDPDTTPRETFLRKDVRLLVDGGEWCGNAVPPPQAVVLLPGWRESRGARYEAWVAHGLGLEFAEYCGPPDVVSAKVSGEWVLREVVWALGREARGNAEFATVAHEALAAVTGPRNTDYGHPLDDFAKTAGMMTALFRERLREGMEFGPDDVPKLMTLVKLSRWENRPKRDNLVDIIGYALTAEMVERERARRNGTNNNTAEDGNAE